MHDCINQESFKDLTCEDVPTQAKGKDQPVIIQTMRQEINHSNLPSVVPTISKPLQMEQRRDSMQPLSHVNALKGQQTTTSALTVTMF